jgi:hypothetical protein
LISSKVQSRTRGVNSTHNKNSILSILQMRLQKVFKPKPNYNLSQNKALSPKNTPA